MKLEFGDVVLVRFPFTDQLGAKRRPAVVVSSSHYQQVRPDVILAAVTSNVSAATEDLGGSVIEWERAGLYKASAVKPVFFTADRAIVTRVLGHFSAVDKAGLANMLARAFGP